MKFYTYEKEIGNTKIFIGIIKEKPINKTLKYFLQIVQLLLILYIFYFNANFVHSCLLSLFGFILALCWLSRNKTTKAIKLSSKEIFLEKVEELTPDDNP